MSQRTGQRALLQACLTGFDRIAVSSGYAHYLAALIGGKQAEVVYAGSAPGFVEGAMQVNVRVPEGISSGSAVPVILIVGSSSSQANVTLAVQ